MSQCYRRLEFARQVSFWLSGAFCALSAFFVALITHCGSHRGNDRVGDTLLEKLVELGG